MTLEELIYRRLAAMPLELAEFNGTPAVFWQSAPPDVAAGWAGKPQYPRVDYTVELRADPERQTAGLLTLNICCESAGKLPEELEPLVRAALCGVFLCPTGGIPYSLAWQRSDVFEEKNAARGKADALIFGVTVLFDVYAFPLQSTTDPDPVLAMNLFLREWNNAAVVGLTELPECFALTERAPVLYVRLTGLHRERETNTVVWMTATLAGHVFAPDAATRLFWLKALADELAVRGEMTMADGSPLFLTNISVNSEQDALTSGQMRIGVRFGILCKRDYAHPLMDVNKEVLI